LDNDSNDYYDDYDGPASNNSQEKMQLYHDLLLVLLQELNNLSVNKPVLWVNLGGVWQQRRLHIHVCAVSMGDQKSQDHLCGRKLTNNGLGCWSLQHHQCHWWIWMQVGKTQCGDFIE
jgi:hypothetical protein